MKTNLFPWRHLNTIAIGQWAPPSSNESDISEDHTWWKTYRFLIWCDVEVNRQATGLSMISIGQSIQPIAINEAPTKLVENTLFQIYSRVSFNQTGATRQRTCVLQLYAGCSNWQSLLYVPRSDGCRSLFPKLFQSSLHSIPQFVAATISINVSQQFEKNILQRTHLKRSVVFLLLLGCFI